MASTARPYDALTALRFFGSECFAFPHVPDAVLPLCQYYHMPVVRMLRMGFRKGTLGVF